VYSAAWSASRRRRFSTASRAADLSPPSGGRPARQLLTDLERGGLLSLHGEGVVAGVSAVPAEGLRSLQRQVECLVVRALHQHYSSPKDQELGDLRLRRRTGCEDYCRQTGRGSHAGQRRTGVAGRGGDHRFGADLSRPSHDDCAGAIFEGGRRVAAIILEPHLGKPGELCKTRRVEHRRPSHGMQRSALVPGVVDRKERQVAPNGQLARGGNRCGRSQPADRRVIEHHIQVAAILWAGVRYLARPILSRAQ